MLLDLATRQDIEEIKALLALIANATPKPAPENEELVTPEWVGNYTKFDPRTVREWAKKGRFTAAGERIYLPAYEFSAGMVRFKRSEVEAFGLGIGVLVPSQIAGQPPEAAKQAPITKKKRQAVDSRQALKVA